MTPTDAVEVLPDRSVAGSSTPVATLRQPQAKPNPATNGSDS